MGKVYEPAYKLEICKQVESGTVTQYRTLGQIEHQVLMKENSGNIYQNPRHAVGFVMPDK